MLSSSQCVTTNVQGAYSIPNVPAGNQTVRASAGGYTTLQQAVTVPAGGTATANFSLAATPPTWTNITTENFELAFPRQAGPSKTTTLAWRVLLGKRASAAA